VATSAIFHDYFSIRGGGERLVLDLARGLEAAVVTGYRTNDSYPESDFPADYRELSAIRIPGTRGLTALSLAFAFARARPLAANYGTRIFSGVTAPFAAPPLSAPGRNIFYCHTPPRFLYDQRAGYVAGMSAANKLAFAVAAPLFQRDYERTIGNMHVVVANSENTRRRIRRYLGRDSLVVYPPVDTEAFGWGEPQGYYLSTARLSPLKRVDRIVDAFLALPDKRLVIASGGEQNAELRRRAAGAPNISFTGWTSDAQLRELVAGAIATVYVPVDEDFGMSAVESMAAGKPVIGVAEGGLLETVVPGETGILLPSDFRPADLAARVRTLDARAAHAMRAACEARATQFTRRRFLDAMRSLAKTV
jgi:glycosyltransferase involved in cell wall biosynthesis